MFETCQGTTAICSALVARNGGRSAPQKLTPFFKLWPAFTSHNFPLLRSGCNIEHIAVGLVVKVAAATSKDAMAMVAICFCPPKKAKPQTSKLKRQGTMYTCVFKTELFKLLRGVVGTR